jgi:hypothetical protein
VLGISRVKFISHCLLMFFGMVQNALPVCPSHFMVFFVAYMSLYCVGGF